MFNPDALTLINSDHLWLEIPETELAKNWQQSQAFSTSSRRWITYLNRLSLNTFLPWLRSEYAPEANPFPSVANLPSISEVVNGTGISLKGVRLALIPTEAADLSELRVPQEWVDIPSWVADYYLAVQVNVEERYIRIWGYTTHKQLKSMASYDAGDRAYCLDGEDLISNISILWVARQICPEEVTRLETPQLPELSAPQTNNLLNRLGNPAIISPRTAVPFQIWGALLEHGGWRQRLYEQRQGMQQQWSITQWLQTGVSEFGQKFGWGSIDSQLNLAGARGSSQASTLPTLVRRLTIAGEQYELRVQPKGNITSRVWRFELRKATRGELIPSGVKFRLLTEDLQPFDGNQVRAKTPVDQLYIEVALGTSSQGLVWQTEPTPEDYQSEILFF
ncbi:DUF1822 family protein [Aetokthonos hydrillicola Thurmond2011]|jgi:hypothetical protein|uniref:DUF1822 family protein n=1 Tax=Aetokthonos hydrillicola Thurmond2011 TaxID=2712845 RepID=A0AAP5I7S2_9CYAN|nr:DUF1822 family protein [Aetokthonos hydrillicola]MBO3458230.1 DUF1822 family protein [Aetokthonos hydrillicola CCALA 1050]MBW4584449.1 DUF1822 family protein [Aetokthonos hydrillicola CCALA 1050]MDR9896411.1 DUF1822 family protein [Aetokthonos hydrillicola Thurmond2011]